MAVEERCVKHIMFTKKCSLYNARDGNDNITTYITHHAIDLFDCYVFNYGKCKQHAGKVYERVNDNPYAEFVLHNITT